MKTYEQVMQLTRTISGSPALEEGEAEGLYACCLEVPKDGSVVEIGCQVGRSSTLLAQMAKEIGFHTVHIDPYIDDPHYLPQWVANMQKVGQPFMFLYMRSELAGEYVHDIDLLFVDGDHEYPAVLGDLKLFGPKVKVGGFLTCHDYANEGLPGVKQAVSEYIDDQWEVVGVFGSLGVWRKR